MLLRVFLDKLEEGVVFLDGGRRVLQMKLAAKRMLGQADESFDGSFASTMR